MEPRFGCEDLVAADGEVDGVDPRRSVARRHAPQHEGELSRRQRFAAALRNGAADHQLGELRPAGPGGRHLGDLAAAPQHGDPVAERHDLAQLVADEDDGEPVPGEAAQHREQPFGLLRRQHRGRLVEDQHAGVAVEGLQDLDALGLADRERGHPGVQRHLQARGSHERLQPGAGGGHVLAQPPHRLGAEHDVVEHAEVAGQREVLVDHADAGEVEDDLSRSVPVSGGHRPSSAARGRSRRRAAAPRR